jgi:hypothetical protein
LSLSALPAPYRWPQFPRPPLLHLATHPSFPSGFSAPRTLLAWTVAPASFSPQFSPVDHPPTIFSFHIP